MSKKEMEEMEKEQNQEQEQQTADVTEENKLEKELQATKLQLAETSDRYLRVLAEYDNFRKRSQKERDSIYSDAYVDAVKNLLPVIDNIERVMTLEGDKKFMQGLELIVTQIHETLNKMGVKEIECKEFDPNMHNAVMHIEDEAYGENEIVEVFQKGYIYGEKVIRYAMVKVAN